MRFARPRSGRWLPALLVASLLCAGCSVKRFAVNRVGDALAAGGSTFASDDDPELVAQATPFSLKLMESLLAESPRHEGLLTTLAGSFTQYAYAFVQQPADELERQDFDRAQALRARAARLYLRARDYALRGLELRHRGIAQRLAVAPETALSATSRRDVPFLYWAAVSWGAAIALSKDDPFAVAEIPQMEALIDRALALDEGWNEGAIHTFLVSYEMSRQGGDGEPAARARAHFVRARALGADSQVGPLVAFAESVSLARQDRTEFVQLLETVVAFDPDRHPQHRLSNLVLQRRARWLLDQTDDLFLTEVPAE